MSVYKGGTGGSGVLPSSDDVLEMSVVRGVGGVCMGVGGVGVRGLGLGTRTV